MPRITGQAMSRWPDFFVIGAAKAGTTSLYHYLGEHPEICLSPVHEPAHFAYGGRLPPVRGALDTPQLEKYLYANAVLAPEDYRQLFRQCRTGQLCGDISPQYLYFPGSADRIYADCPDARIIVILRHPHDRAWSHYRMNRRLGIEPLGYSDALCEEPNRISEGWSWDYHYREVGHYHKQLPRYFELFGREAVRVFLYDELQHDPARMLAEICRFLGLSIDWQPDLDRRWNQDFQPRSERLELFATAPPTLLKRLTKYLPQNLRFYLRQGLTRLNSTAKGGPTQPPRQPLERYAIAELEDLLGRTLPAWH